MDFSLLYGSLNFNSLLGAIWRVDGMVHSFHAHGQNLCGISLLSCSNIFSVCIMCLQSE